MNLTPEEQAFILRMIADRLVTEAAKQIPLSAAATAAAPRVVRGVSEFVGEQLGFIGQPAAAKPKRRRRKDTKMSKALKQANSRYRKKDGSLRAGRTQADIMKYAHKLRRKM
ncbi:MAG: hypothetical protein [Circular genetic element sp.]|nr:MAG: hypothetical protein [Circular genetic element sp.]